MRAVNRIRSGLGIATFIAISTSVPAVAGQAESNAKAWRNANERVAKAGGWRAYAREPIPPVDASNPCHVPPVSGESLSEAKAIEQAVSPGYWPPLQWPRDEGSKRRFAVDEHLVETVARTRELWMHAVVAEARIKLLADSFSAVDAAADLATRLNEAGNIPVADALHERRSRAEAGVACRQAIQERAHARSALARQLRKDVDSLATLKLPDALPALPAQPMSQAQQDDLRRRSTVGAPNSSEVLKIKDAAEAYRHAWDVARQHQQDILPLAQRLREESVLRYNGMLIGPGELLAAARDVTAAELAALDALAAFWQADVILQSSLMGRFGSGE